MAGTRYSKRWNLLVDEEDAIFLVKNGQTVRDRTGKPVGPISAMRSPSSRKTCQQAEQYLSHAIEVAHANLDVM